MLAWSVAMSRGLVMSGRSSRTVERLLLSAQPCVGKLEVPRSNAGKVSKWRVEHLDEILSCRFSHCVVLSL